MRISYSWLREYVEIDIEAPELAHLLTMSGSEVESVGPMGEALDPKIIVGQITDLRPHPDGKLLIAAVDTGGEVVTLVTGAPNVAVGQRVPVALAGARLPNGETITAVDFKGVISSGMLCSERELDLGPDHSGILVLPSDTPVGIPLYDALGLGDMIIDLEIYPNRPDCLSVIGIAREVAAITGNTLRLPSVSVVEAGPAIEDFTSVTVEDQDLCPYYSARVIRNVKIGPSPLWLQRRLIAGGMRPINNAVDITNFVLLEMGQPLHAFDYDKLAENRVIVRRARAGESIVTLDDETRILDTETLVIADGEKPVCIAGIMGGANSEVTSGTTNILLEAAIFHGPNIRRSSRRLGLRSEASARYEKGLDPAGVRRAMDRAAQLLVELAGGEVCKGVITVAALEPKPKAVAISPLRCNRLLGADISKGEMVNILSSLGFEVKDQGDELEVKVPSYRLDVELEADLIEEVARVYGYDRLAATLPQGEAKGGAGCRLKLAGRVRDLLTGFGLTEILTYSFDSPTSYDKLLLPEDHPLRRAVVIQNPLTEDWNILRTTLIPNMLNVLQYNAQRQHQDLQIYEVGSVFIPRQLPLHELPEERLTLGVALMGEYPREWGLPAREVDFFDLKGVVEALLDGLELGCEWEAAETPGFHPGRCASVAVQGVKVGIVGEIHPEAAAHWDLPSRVYAAELDLDKILLLITGEKRIEKLPRYPFVARDLALLAPQDVPAQHILEVIQAAGKDLIKGVTLFDVYQGPQVPAGYRSLAYSILYQAEDRTLTDEEVEAVQNRIITHLKDELGITLR
ncbi:MAG: phenylalanine--tRNA ligase subunit beta [Firmicutes bacterium]|nr:phenylalanine--tRNA ligase subunit beta [Bacillota bacterium]